MAGLGVFAVIFGAVTAWAGWTGRNVASVLSATLTGKPQPAAGKNPFQEMGEGFPGLIGGALSGIGSGVVGGIGSAVGGAAGVVTGPPPSSGPTPFGFVPGPAGQTLPGLNLGGALGG